MLWDEERSGRQILESITILDAFLARLVRFAYESLVIALFANCVLSTLAFELLAGLIQAKAAQFFGNLKVLCGESNLPGCDLQEKSFVFNQKFIFGLASFKQFELAAAFFLKSRLSKELKPLFDFLPIIIDFLLLGATQASK